MVNQAEPPLTPESELFRFLQRTLAHLRRGTLVVLLLLALARPAEGVLGLPSWLLVLAFAVYDLAAYAVLGRVSALRAVTWMSLADLPVAGLLYFLAGAPGGPPFVLFLLAVDSAAASMTLRGTLLYTGAAAGLVAAVELASLGLPPGSDDLQGLGVRLVTLALVALGMAVLTRRLVLERGATQAVRDAADRLATLERFRAEFIATISHDLRTPLTAARAGLGLLEASGSVRLRPDERELLANARRNSERLALLIDDLLAFNQLEAGTLRLELEPLDLRSVVRSAVDATTPLLREKEQLLTVDLPEPLPCVGDARRLEQVVVNLLANAHRHTPVGTRIFVADRSTGAEVRLSVRDEGPGIPEAERELIFRRFHRLFPTGEGSGLGLAIARGLAELHGGRLWLESQSNAGADFQLALPRRTDEERP